MFDFRWFLNLLGEDVVAEFSKAGIAQTPGQVGDIRESIVRDKLKLLIPKYCDITSGCIVDSDGNISKQVDIIIYEKDFSLIFPLSDSINYIPCEHVIAAGEVKSVCTEAKLIEALYNINSVKLLKRTYKDPTTYRHYGSTMGVQGVTNFDQEKDPLESIFCFVLMKEISCKPMTFIKWIIKNTKEIDYYRYPNMFYSLSDGFFSYCTNNAIVLMPSDNCIIRNLGQKEDAFTFLIRNIWNHAVHGRTVKFNFDDYLNRKEGYSTQCELSLSCNFDIEE